jgi:rod shape determining protein RodA
MRSADCSGTHGEGRGMILPFKTRDLFKDFDWLLFGAAVILSAIGIAEIYSATQGIATESYAWRQTSRVALGIVLMMVVATVDYRSIAEQIPWIYLLSVGLLLATLLVGQVVSGTKGWLAVAGARFQPSELIKIVTVIAMARYLAERPERKYLSFADIAKGLLVCGVPMYLVERQPDLGTALTYLPIPVVGLFVRGIKPAALVAMILIFLLLLPVSWFVLKPYQKDRILTFIDPERDPRGAGYQVLQSKIAIGAGGFWGKGLMKGTQNRLGFLPTRHTDFILSVVGEELGFLGVAVILGLLGFILFRALDTARTARDSLGLFIAMGIVGIFFFHIAVNVGMVIGFMPITGIPLPFLSYGGSSVLMAFAALGMILNVRRRRFVN